MVVARPNISQTPVFVPFTNLLPDVIDSLRGQANTVEAIDVSASVTGYWELLSRLWAKGQDFIVVEHDVIVRPGTIAALDRCQRPWCSVPARGWPTIADWESSHLQCNRFRKEAILAHPTLLDVPPWSRHWVGLDGQLLPRLQRRIGPPHIHSAKLARHEQGAPHLGHFPAWAPDSWSPVVRAYASWLAAFAPDSADTAELVREAAAAARTGQDDAESKERLAEACYLRQVLGG